MRQRLIDSIRKMMQIQNNSPEFEYGFLDFYTETKLKEMMAGWQQNQPELFAREGIYLM